MESRQEQSHRASRIVSAELEDLSELHYDFRPREAHPQVAASQRIQAPEPILELEENKFNPAAIRDQNNGRPLIDNYYENEVALRKKPDPFGALYENQHINPQE